MSGPDHEWREHACLRVQYVLTGRHGLRALFAPTTDFRAFWDRLSGDVLTDRTDRSTQAAIAALRRVTHPPWAPALGEALVATSTIAQEAARFTAKADDTLYHGVTAPPALHPSGLPAGARGSCGTCVWRFEQRGSVRCRQAEAKVDASWAGCERFEPTVDVDCQTCGACCREAYGAVDVQPRDPAVKAQPDYIVPRGELYEIRRNGDRCAALDGGTLDGTRTTLFRCVIYPDRPRTCREFTLGSVHCLTARRRVGLSQ